MATPSARITYAEDLGTEVVSVYVGPDRKHYVVHKQLLTSQSDYFDKALNGNFKEAGENKIHLEEDDPAAIGLMIGYLYRGVIPGTGKKPTPFTRALAGSGESYSLKPPTFPAFGTSAGPFTPFLAPEIGNPRNTEAFVNICFFSAYEKFSQEELRLSEYRLNKKYAGSTQAAPLAQATAPAPVPNTVGNTAAAPGVNHFSGNLFRAPNASWGTIPPQLPAAQPLSEPTGLFGTPLSGSQPSISPPPAAPSVGTQPPAQRTGLFGTFTSPGAPSILQTQPSLFSTAPQSVFQLAPQNVSIPTSNLFARLGSSSGSGTMGSTAGVVNASGALAPFGAGTTRNTGLSMFDTMPIPKPAPAPKKPGEFGYSPIINYPKPDGSFIKGIPRSEPLGDLMVNEIKLQDTLLHLCIFAETVCWPKLFNAAMDAYMLGELNLLRDILLEHVDIIYDRTHPDSTLRAFVMDSIRRLNNPESCKKYMELAQQYEDFLANLLEAVSLGLAKKDSASTFAERKKSYFMSEEPFAPSKLQKSALNAPEPRDDEVL